MRASKSQHRREITLQPRRGGARGRDIAEAPIQRTCPRPGTSATHVVSDADISSSSTAAAAAAVVTHQTDTSRSHRKHNAAPRNTAAITCVRWSCCWCIAAADSTPPLLPWPGCGSYGGSHGGGTSSAAGVCGTAFLTTRRHITCCSVLPRPHGTAPFKISTTMQAQAHCHFGQDTTHTRMPQHHQVRSATAQPQTRSTPAYVY
jgi:hypothetical protein